MPTTRSATRAVVTASYTAAKIEVSATAEGKRKAKGTSEEPAPKTKKARVTKTKTTTETVTMSVTIASASSMAPEEQPALVPSRLSFSFEEAKRHLVEADPRFEDLFERLKCTPFEELEMVHPFRALTKSIIGQQISWQVARVINHKFVRLFDPSIPENHADYSESKSATSFFPTPHQVANTDIGSLRGAGLSGRKAEYVQDLAARFADGRLSTEKLLAASDQELAEMLIAVKGIGPWTVDMFAIFSLRRPDILPVGDLGVQRGMLRWFLALHSPTYNVTISPEKEKSGSKKKGHDSSEEKRAGLQPEVPSPDASSMLPATPKKGKRTESDADPLPAPFTPSIKKALRKIGGAKTESLPAGLTAAIMKSRLDGKKKIKGAMLTPTEMEELSMSWKPYRSIGVYYMWALADAEV
ncbi:dna-3-methyladenine glycosidase [Moniliophthora roreri]|uniref:Putative DNA glycosylase n=1 Tax=Moniliophthora roreri TaxID=221103 RepID=A0A0W0F5P1_MONRR|nr:dna-3-methyladenine glycosidase [Moniliophthora roreri]